MFDIGWAEMLVLGIVVLLVMGPREIPTVLRTLGHYLGRMRALAAEFRMHIDNLDAEIAPGEAVPPQAISQNTKTDSPDLFAAPKLADDKTDDEKQG